MTDAGRVPRGIERLLTLAAMNAGWRAKVLADPLAAAGEAKIDLSDGEKAVLQATPRAALEEMVRSFEKKRGGSTAAKVAVGVGVGVAATGLAVVALGSMVSTAGIRTDVPPPDPNKVDPVAPVPLSPARPGDVPEVHQIEALRVALAEARKSNWAVMAVFPVSLGKSLPDPNRGISVEEQSQLVCQTGSPEFRLAVKDACLVAAQVPHPSGRLVSRKDEASAKEAKRVEAESAAYQAVLKRYGLDEKKLPAVVFLAPDGSELSKLVQPTEEARLIEAVGAVPPLLAKWLADRESMRRQPPQEWSWGHRP
jgi:hypothetical protein